MAMEIIVGLTSKAIHNKTYFEPGYLTLSGSRTTLSQFDARLISIAELYSRHLQGLLDDLERCSARSCFSKLEYPDGRNSNAGGLGELLLIPVKQSASRSALGRREHVSAMGKLSQFVNLAESG